MNNLNSLIDFDFSVLPADKVLEFLDRRQAEKREEEKRLSDQIIRSLQMDSRCFDGSY